MSENANVGRVFNLTTGGGGQAIQTAKSVDIVLSASAWAGDAAPYTQTVDIGTQLADGQVCLISGSETMTETQREAARGALLQITAHSGSRITVTADGDKPDTDIPATVVVFTTTTGSFAGDWVERSELDEAINSLKTSVSEGKALVAAAVTDKGVETAADAAFSVLAENIGEITTGPDTSQDTVTASAMLSGVTAHDKDGNAITGTIPSQAGATYPVAKTDTTIAAGRYLAGAQTIKGVFAIAIVSAPQAGTVTVTNSGGVSVPVSYQTGRDRGYILDTAGTYTASCTYNGETKAQEFTIASGGGVAVRIAFAGIGRVETMELSVARSKPATATVGNYALVMGGSLKNKNSSTVDAYNSSLTRTTPTELSIARERLAATTVGNYALAMGGMFYLEFVGSTYYVTVDAYDSSLTRTTPTELSAARSEIAAATVGSYALAMGGEITGNVGSNRVDAYNSSLTRTTPTELSIARDNLAATTVGNYALAMGGCMDIYPWTHYVTVDAYNSSLTRTTPTELSVARGEFAAATVGNYALAMGGSGDGAGYPKVVDAYDSSLTRTTATELNVGRRNLAAATVGNYALAMGGYGGSVLATVDAYDSSLTRTTATELSVGRYNLAAATVGSYGLAIGGYSLASGYHDDVDAYAYTDDVM